MSDEQIAAALSRYNAQLAEIRADESLSDKGKADRISEIYQQTKTKVTELRGKQDDVDDTSVSKLTRSLFGLPDQADPTAVISHRDAVDRVSAVKRPEALGDLMQRARQSGDTSLLRAAFAHAWEQSRKPLASDGWGDLVNEYIRWNPGIADQAEELARLTDPRSKQQRFMKNLAQAVIKPKELK